jgi:hypothetical protein
VTVIEGQWCSTRFHRRIATWGGVGCILMASLAFTALADRTPTPDNFPWAVSWFIGWALPGTFILTRARIAAVRVTSQALEVRNAFRSFSVPWEEIERLGFGWAGGFISLGYVKPKGRRKRLLSGIRRWTSSENDLVDELNRALAEHVHLPPPPPGITESSRPRPEPPRTV